MPQSLIDLIDLRAFSSLWYWVLLTLAWSSVTSWVLGVPSDLLARARAGDTHAQTDLIQIAHIGARRRQEVWDETGIWLTFGATFVVATLAGLSFSGSEAAQAALLLVAPLSGVSLITLRTARKVRQADDTRAVITVLYRHRLMVHAIAICAIFATAVFGMYHVLISAGPHV